MAGFKALIPAAALSAILAACGGGGSSAPTATSSAGTPTPSTPGPTVDVPVGTAGVYDVNYGQFSGVYTLLDNGDFYGIHFVSGDVLAGHPHGPLSKQNSVSSMEHIAWANFIDDAQKIGAQEPNGMFGRTFNASSLNVAISGSMGSFTATTTRQKIYTSGSSKTIYFDALPLSAIAGNYQGKVRTAGFGHQQETVSNFTIDGNGVFASSAGGCSINGTMSQHGTTGIFDAQAQSSGSGCPFAGTLKGIVTPLRIENNVPTLGFQLDSPDNMQSIVFIVTKG